MTRVKSAIRWQNDMVMVFGADGQQIPDLQGRYEHVYSAVLAAADDATVFKHGAWRDWLVEVERDRW